MNLYPTLAGMVLAASLASPALSQPVADAPKNPQVKIEYGAPRSPALKEVHDRVRKYRVLELLQEFLVPLRLPKELTVRTAECGGVVEIPYKPGEPVTICYEFLRDIEGNAPVGKVIRVGPYPLTKDAIIIGGFTNLVLNQVAAPIIDMLEVPVWGRMEDAADFVSALVMLEFHKEPIVIWSTLAGTSWYLAQRSFMGLGNFTDVVRSADAQRFYNYACMAAGANPSLFGFLISNKDIPEGRARGCAEEYRSLKRSFAQTILPHIDAAKLKQVRELNWPARLNLTSK